MIQAEIIDGRIAVRGIPWDGGRGRDRAKSIPGARPKYDDNKKFQYWSYPLAMSTASALRKEFGRDLQLGPRLTEWGWDERRKNEELEKLRAGQDADLPRVREHAPVLWQALQNRPFQITGAAFVVRGRHVCLGDEPRLGKTYQALAAMVETGAQRVLIACPRVATRTVWATKINELTPKYMPFVAQGSRAQREQVIKAFNEMPYGLKVLIINLEMIRIKRRWECQGAWEPRTGQNSFFKNSKGKWESASKPGSRSGCMMPHDHKTVYYPEYPELFEKSWDAIILDESHHALASEKNVQSDQITQIRLGAVKLPVAPEGMSLAMSGTPFRARLTKSWGVLNWLRPDAFPSFWRYAETLFEVSSNGWGGAKVIGRLRSEEALQDTLRPYYLARTKADVAPQLPPVQYVDVKLPMEDKQAEAYRGIIKDARAELDTGTLDANGILAELTRMKQFACSYGRMTGRDFYPAAPSNKLDWILEFLEEIREVQGTKVVIASQFTKLIKVLAEEVRNAGWQVLTLTGESTDAQRDHAQLEFLNGKTRVIIVNMFAGGEAIDLSSADDLILVDEPWTDDTRQQVENRIQNLAKRQAVTVHRLRSKGTIDERIGNLTDEQRKQLLAAKPAILKEVLA